MPGEVRIHVDVDASGRYRFRLRSGTREITTSVNPNLAASFYEDLRLLRWKSAGIHNPRGCPAQSRRRPTRLPHRTTSKMERTRTTQ